jgi:hypothetical protein
MEKTQSYEDLIKTIKDYEERFSIIKGLLFYEYGSISNDDLLGFIDKAIPKKVEPKKLD